MLSADASGRQIVSVHVKRGYRLLPTGECRRAEMPVPLLFSRAPENEEEFGVPESDVIPFKQSTDLIVMAKAHAPRGATRADVSLALEQRTWCYRVWGPRRCLYRGAGSWTFSQPEPFDEVPLSYAMAYGGMDTSYPMPEGVPLESAFTLPPNAYPRNTVGRGYVIRESRDRMDGLLLPQLENPTDLLEPARLLVGDPRNWWRQPFPWSMDWFDGFWFPRSGFFGTLPLGFPEDDAGLFEVRSGWLAAGQAARLRQRPAAERLDTRFADAASPALVLPFLRGNEAVRLEGVLPGGNSIVVRLPGDAPRVRLRHGGQDHDLAVRPHRVLISTIELGVYVVWHAAFYPPQPLPLNAETFEPRRGKELEGITVTSDGMLKIEAERLELVGRSGIELRSDTDLALTAAGALTTTADDQAIVSRVGSFAEDDKREFQRSRARESRALGEAPREA